MPRISKEEEQRREGVVAIHKLKFVTLMQDAEREFGPAFRKSGAHARIAEEGLASSWNGRAVTSWGSCPSRG